MHKPPSSRRKAGSGGGCSVQLATVTFLDSWCREDSVLDACCCCCCCRLRPADLAACLARRASSCICSSRHSSLQKGVSPLYMKMSASRPSGRAQSAQASSAGRLGSYSGSASKKKAEAMSGICDAAVACFLGSACCWFLLLQEDWEVRREVRSEGGGRGEVYMADGDGEGKAMPRDGWWCVHGHAWGVGWENKGRDSGAGETARG
ncbi:hypothetical protein U9M48_033596 [Paspalum notatum var. saurae]|uniref:Uncharacterized protein n=1 Tax=Paspalum notatum var. saurae TaxID=547442 RepID=A0AAQ3X5T8_PASNO